MKKILIILSFLTIVLAQTHTINAHLLVKGDISMEGNADDDFEGRFTLPSVTADRTWTLPDTDLNFGSILLDVMTTRGDILYRNSSNVTARLGLGSNKYVLQSDGTDLAWSEFLASEMNIVDSGLYYTATQVEAAFAENRPLINANTAKVSNVSTSLTLGTPTATTVPINSDGSSPDITLIEATTTTAGLLGAAKWNEIVANTAKVTNTDDQKIDVFTGSGNTISLSLENDGEATKTLDISGFTAIAANTAKNTNVSTSLSVGTVGINTVAITSDGGADDVTLPAATVTTAGMLTTAKWGEIVANNAKNTNVSTSLTLGTPTATTVLINSDGSSPDVTLIEATTTTAGLLGASKWDEIVANSLKATNVSTALSEGTRTATTYGITSDGGSDDLVMPEANTTQAGLLGAGKWDEIVASTTHSGLTNDPHSVTATQVGLGSVSNVATSDVAYNATSWDANLDAATKNAIRDKIETLGGGHDAVTLNANATAAGISLSTQEINYRASTNAQSGYATAAQITAQEANTSLLNVTPGTATASKALVVDANKDIDLDTGDLDANIGVFDGTLTTNSNYVMEGHATGRNVDRSIVLRIQPGATPNTDINITDKSDINMRGFNYPSITDVTNLTATETDGQWTLSADGTLITLNLTESVIGITNSSFEGAFVINSASADLYLSLVESSTGSLDIYIYKQSETGLTNWLSIMDASDRVDLRISFKTST